MAGELTDYLQRIQTITQIAREPLCRYLGKPIPNKPFPTSSNEDYTYDIEKATADLMFMAKLKQGAFFVLLMSLTWYYGTIVWFVIASIVSYMWEHGYVDPRGPNIDHDPFAAG